MNKVLFSNTNTTAKSNSSAKFWTPSTNIEKMAVRIDLLPADLVRMVIVKLKWIEQQSKFILSKSDASFYKAFFQIFSRYEFLFVKLEDIVQIGFLCLAPSCHNIESYYCGVFQSIMPIRSSIALGIDTRYHFFQILVNQFFVHEV